ncbi:MAG: hypothetical protein ACRDZ3_17980 [Acidimicrobiia bacterium]
MKRNPLALGIVLAIGAVMAVGALSLPAKTQGVDDLTNAFRPAFTAASLTQTRRDMDTVKAMATELDAKAIPALAAQLGATPDQFRANLAAGFPAVGAGMRQLPTILPYFDGVVGGLEAQAANFRLADAIPAKPFPATLVTYLFLLPGLALAAAAALGLLRPARFRTVALGVAATVGVVLIVAPLALSVPKKTQAVDNLTNAFRPAFSAEGARTSRAHMDTVQSMADELTGKALPALAAQLKVTPDQLAKSLAANFPAVATGVDRLGTILPRFQALVAGVERNGSNFTLADSIPTGSTPTTLLHWLFVIPAGVLVATGSAGLLAARRVRARQPAVDGARFEPAAAGR